MNIESLDKKVIAQIRSSLSINSVTQCAMELVLNSLDAKSTAISVRVDLSSFRIQVIDNGNGISRSNLELLGHRYMTNKCHTLSDLRKRLKFYGFRGESLPNIIEVSKHVIISSREKNADVTYTKTFERAETCCALVKNRPSVGTTVTVAGFLANLPVRQQCIKKAELEILRQHLESLAIIHPQVSFTLRNDLSGILMMSSKKCGSIITSFMNIHNLPEEDKFTTLKIIKGNISIQGLIYRDPHENKKLQYIYVNKRPVNNKKIQNIINDLYKKSTDGKRKYPIILLHIKCPYAEIDLTLEPAKTEVYFKKFDKIKYCVEKIICSFLGIKKNPETTHKTYSNEKNFGISQIGGAVKCCAKRKNDEHLDVIPEKSQKIVEDISLLSADDHAMFPPKAALPIEIKRATKRPFQDNDEIRETVEAEKVEENSFFTYFPDDEKRGKNVIMDMFIKSVHVFADDNISESTVSDEKNQNQISAAVQTRESPPLNAGKHNLVSVGVQANATMINNGIKQNFEFISERTDRIYNEKFNVQTPCNSRKRSLDNSLNCNSSDNFVRENRKHEPLETSHQQGFLDNSLNCNSLDNLVRQHGKHELKEYLRHHKQEHIPLETSHQERSFDNSLNCNSLDNLVRQNRKHEYLSRHQVPLETPHSKYFLTKSIDLFQTKVSNDIDQTFFRDDMAICSKRPFRKYFSDGSFLRQKKTLPSFRFDFHVSPPAKTKKEFNLENRPFDATCLENARLSPIPKVRLEKGFKKPDTKRETIQESPYFSKNFKKIKNVLPLPLKVENRKEVLSSFNFKPSLVDSFPVETYTRRNMLFDVKLTPCKQKLNRRTLNETTVSKFFEPMSSKNRSQADDDLNNIFLAPTNENNFTLLKHYTQKVSGDFLGETQNQAKEAPDISVDLFPSNNKEKEDSQLIITINDSNEENVEEDSTSIQRLWIKKINEFGKTVYLNKATGFCSIHSPKEDLHFNVAGRYDFMPKGTSPILKDCDPINPLSPESKEYFQNEVIKSYDDELLLVKWEKCINNKDPKSFFDEVYMEKSKLIEDPILDVTKNNLAKHVAKLFECKNFSNEMFNNLEIIGQIDCKFIAALEKDNNLVMLFDQHAVHERVRLEMLAEGYNVSIKINNKIPLFLLQSDLKLIQNQEQNIKFQGLIFNFFANGINVTEVPLCVYNKHKKGVSLSDLVETLIKEIIQTMKTNNGLLIATPKVILNILHSEACRGSIKFGDLLTRNECNTHLKNLSKCNLPFQCAHGRPTLTPLISLNNNDDTKKNFYKINLKKLKT